MSKIVEDYILVDVIGSGQYGKVWRAEHIKTKEQYAIKSISIKQINSVDKLKEFVNSEIACLEMMQNKNIVKYYGKLQTTNNYYLIFEFCRGGTLEDVIKKETVLSEAKALSIFDQILNAFSELNRLNIMHRDIKPSNVLLDNGVVKLADFGFCKKMKTEREMTKSIVGSPIYMAPELLQGQYYTIKADIWSLGVLLYEMMHGKCPYEENSIPSLLDKIKNSVVRYNTSISTDTMHLMQSMLVFNSEDRISWTDLFKRIKARPPLISSLEVKKPITSYQFLRRIEDDHQLTEIIESNFFLKSLVRQLETAGIPPLPLTDMKKNILFNKQHEYDEFNEILKHRFCVKFLVDKIKQVYLIDMDDYLLINHMILLMFKKARKHMLTAKIKITYSDTAALKDKIMEPQQLFDYIENETNEFDQLYGAYLKEMSNIAREESIDELFRENIDKPFDIDDSHYRDMTLKAVRRLLALDNEDVLSTINGLLDALALDTYVIKIVDFREKDKHFDNYNNRLTNREMRILIDLKTQLLTAL